MLTDRDIITNAHRAYNGRVATFGTLRKSTALQLT